MTITLNNFAKYFGDNSQRTMLAALQYNTFRGSAGTSFFRVFPNTVTYPDDPTTISSSTSGYIISVALAALTPFSYSTVSNSIIFTNGSISLTPTADGVLGWWAILNVEGGGNIISDSITTTGGTGILKADSLSVSNGVPKTFTFNLTIT